MKKCGVSCVLIPHDDTQINTHNIPVFVLWIAASLIGAGILNEGAGMPLPFAVRSHLNPSL